MKQRISPGEIFVIVAAYNEERHIRDVVRRVRAQGFPNVVVVSDGSKDKTEAVALAAGATVLKHITNLGKGGALKTGADYALREGAQALIFLDGDGQHEPEELPKFRTALGTADIVFSARRRTGRMPFVLRFGNWFISTLIKRLYHLDLHDSQCGYRAMRAKAYPLVRWRSNDYSVESEMIAWASKAHLSYAEVPIRTIYHDKYKGTTPLDGFPIVWNLVMWRLQRRKTDKKRAFWRREEIR